MSRLKQPLPRVLGSPSYSGAGYVRGGLRGEAHTKQFFDYGLGWGVGKSAEGRTVIQHSGGVPGFLTYMVGDVDARVGVYVMSNSGDTRPIAMAALALLRGES